MKINVESYGISDVGFVRKNNEDAWAALPNCAFFVLADGMGGHQAGEVASEKTVETLTHEIEKLLCNADLSSKETAPALLKKSIERANQKVYQLSLERASYAGMGTTLACMWIYQDVLIFAHVGDSRIYRFRDKILTQLTEDHSLRQELIAKGELNTSTSRACKNILTKAIGTQREVLPTVELSNLEDNDIYFLCSDGLTDDLSFKEMQSILLKSKTIKEASDNLVHSAKEKGGYDNITVVMVKISKK
ncbi:MAG: Stp1/IreP family PP2C-type Ser/Thr phosphatase [Chlamydiales bacterium]